ncbi:hypothetical protein GCM10018773_58500 [Streptomyces candidus]|nr:hypothetical protein GCM10018773_58500 [Streptomyces candidus]
MIIESQSAVVFGANSAECCGIQSREGSPGMHNDEGRHQEPLSPMPATATERRFEIPVSRELLRQLQGVLCIRCAVQGGRLFPDGRAFTVSSNDCAPLAWDVRAHAHCIGASR